MTDRDPLDRLRQSFVEVAERDAARRRRWRAPKWLVVALTASLGAGSIAVAAELIAIGEPETDRGPRVERFAPAGPSRIDVTAADDPLPWGVSVYPNDRGEPCAVVGQVRAGRLGALRGSTFRPYTEDAAGVCRPRDAALRGSYERRAGRALVFGVVRDDVATVRVRHDGETAEARPGRSGAFIFVFGDDLQLGSFQVDPLDAAGRPVAP